MISANKFSGLLPVDFPELLALYLNTNNITGSLPSSWGSPTAFQKLALLFFLGTNDVDGSLPEAGLLKEHFHSCSF